MKLVPREETKAYEFVQENPKYNGKNVIIGILDTGVDPGAIGLGSLPDSGETKLIDTYDCTGSGDVRMTIEATATFLEDKNCWSVKGLSGKTLYLNSSFDLKPFPVAISDAKKDEKETTKKDKIKEDSKENVTIESTKTGPLRLGIKRAYELFPRKLTARVKAHRNKLFQQTQSKKASEIRQQLQKWHQSNPNANNATPKQIADKKDLEARLEIFESTDSAQMDSLYLSDPGPIYDCIMYFDGTHYRAIVDTNDSNGDESDLTQSEVLTNYRDCEKIGVSRYASFGTVEMFHYAINIFDNGTVLSIVCDAGAHGSHVSGITSAYFPAQKTDSDDLDTQRDGVAPGAQLISFKIGDTRLGSMETGSALVRALILAIQLKCDVINLSYGEAVALPNTGRFIQLAERLVQEYGITFVSSAGNNGPAITTVGAPGGTSTSPISVGAYVSPDMMSSLYSQLPYSEDGTNENNESEEHYNGTTYTWSSLGPAPDGGIGVDIIAPGGAITSVPNWTLQKNQLMNGTSMSSPHVAGCVALLLSAAKANGISTNSNRIKRAVVNTAETIANLNYCQQGSGMIHVQKAWEYLKRFKDDYTEDIFFDVYISNRSNYPRGVYLRQPHEVSVKQTFSVFVDPRISHSNAPVDHESQEKKINFEMLFQLESTHECVTVPKDFVLMNNGRSFQIIVDPTILSPGLHTIQVLAFVKGDEGRGPMFTFPVTITIPVTESANVALHNLSFKPAEVKHFFLSVPTTASWMDISLHRPKNSSPNDESSEDISPRLIALHTLQLLPHTPYRDEEKQKYFRLTPGQTAVTSIRVHGGITCELALARYWSTIGGTNINVEVVFHGVCPSPEEVTLSAGGGGAKVFLNNHLEEAVTISPEVKLSKWKTCILPSSQGEIKPLGERDVLPFGQNVKPGEGKQIYELLLSYEFEQKQENASITPRIPSLQGYLYESEFESQLIQIYDSNKKLLGVCDSWPDAIEVPKGTKATIQVQVRHENVKTLEKLKSQALWIERKLGGKEISLSTFSSHENMMKGKHTFSARKLRKGCPAVVFIADPAKDKLPDGVKCGDILEGSVKYAKIGDGTSGDSSRPGGYKVRYVVGSIADVKDSSKATGKVPDPEDKRTEVEKLQEAINKLKLDELEKAMKDSKDKDRFSNIYKLLENEFIDKKDLQAIRFNIIKLRYEDRKSERESRLQEIISCANTVIESIDVVELVGHYGTTGYYDKEDPEASKERKEMDETKKNLMEALARKWMAMVDGLKVDNTNAGITKEGIDETMKNIKKWVNIDSDLKYAGMVLEREKGDNHLGEILKLLNKLIKSKGEETKDSFCPLSLSDLLKRREDVLKELNCDHLIENDKKWRLIFDPKDYGLF